MNRLNTTITLSFTLMLGVVGSALAQQKQKIVDSEFARTIVKEGFEDSGSVKGAEKNNRINQSELQRACSDVAKNFAGKDWQYYADLGKAEMANIKYPIDGKYLGDWKKGEALAQSGRGLTWTDNDSTAIGGGCYNCHQISPKEISHGTIGPSLLGYGKTRGNKEETLKTTWAHIWNAKAFNACSWMPRFGDGKILTEAQIKDLMALLHDPESPVNK